jgi:hypothetical protein
MAVNCEFSTYIITFFTSIISYAQFSYSCVTVYTATLLTLKLKPAGSPVVWA